MRTIKSQRAIVPKAKAKDTAKAKAYEGTDSVIQTEEGQIIARYTLTGKYRFSIGELGIIDTRYVPFKLRNITRRNVRNSPLLQLPAEIRHRIFQNVFDVQVTLKCYLHPTKRTTAVYHRVDASSDLMTATYERLSGPGGDRRSVGKTYLVCRQMYQETIRLLYSKPLFTLHESQALGIWLKGLKPAQTQIITQNNSHWNWCTSLELPGLENFHETQWIPREETDVWLRRGVAVTYGSITIRPGELEKRMAFYPRSWRGY